MQVIKAAIIAEKITHPANAVFEKCYIILTCYSAIYDTIYSHLCGENLLSLQFVYFGWSAYIFKTALQLKT